jgi:septal ring factor EnvC (AmiA/AmiB activator)
MFGIPLEYLMFGGIGFCLAWLTALMVLPAVHNRAARLARQRYDDLPLSMQEIRAEKDTIRAGFAAATRDLELRIEKLRDKTVAHATDVAKKHQLIERMKQEIETLTAALRESETREQSARDGLREAKRGFADKDVTLGTVEGQMTILQRELSVKDTSLQAALREIEAMRSDVSTKAAALQIAERDRASLRSELEARDSALAGATREVISIRASLGESEARERAANDALSAIRRGSADKDATLGVVEGEIASLQRELATRDAALRNGEREIASLRSELAGKDAALSRAEREIAAIKAEIAALTTLLVQPVDDNSHARAERPAASSRRVEVVPFVAASRQMSQPQPVPAQPVLQQAELHPVRLANEPPAARPPVGVVPVPTRLIPPAIPRAQQQGDDTAAQALTEISDAARRVDERHAGVNQQLRAIYAPAAKSTP